jgi:hypothetical protein
MTFVGGDSDPATGILFPNKGVVWWCSVWCGHTLIQGKDPVTDFRET